MTGLKLVYGATERSAWVGTELLFTAWIINDTWHPIRGVELKPGSFTNEAMEDLQYDSQPSQEQLRIGWLRPGQTVQRSFSYIVTSEDAVHGGEIISAMRVHGTGLFRAFVDEQDASVILITRKCEGVYSDTT